MSGGIVRCLPNYPPEVSTARMSSFRHVSVEHSLTVKARPNEPCTCGSGKKYKKCCGRDPLAERASDVPRTLASQRALGAPGAEPMAAELASLTAHLNANRHAQLESAVRELLGRYPRAGFLWKVLGLALWAQGKDALEALERAVALLPQDAEAHGNLGNAYRS